MVGILISFWDGLFSGAMLVSGSVLCFFLLVLSILGGELSRSRYMKLIISRYVFLFKEKMVAGNFVWNRLKFPEKG